MTSQPQHQPTGVYSDTEIIAGLEQGHIVCDPTPAQINGSSIDVTLGYYFYRAGGSRQDELFNPFDQASTRQYFGDYLTAKPWCEARRKISRPEVADIDTLVGIDDAHPVIVLHPNERILAHTHEFIGILPPGTTSMQARSTTGRIGISACYCAGWGDPGYINRWTMEIHNLNEHSYVVLPIGYRIAQIVFSATGPVATEYTKASGNYQPNGNTDLAMVKQAWRPWMMLPRAYASPVKLPPPVTGLSDGLM